MNSLCRVLLAACMMIVSTVALGADLLTAADIEKITGQSGVKKVAKGSSPAANVDLNFSRADGRFLIGANLNDAKYYDDAKKAVGKVDLVTGVGDEAFMPSPWSVYVRRGK